MNGNEIYDVLSNESKNQNLARFTDILKDEMNDETLAVGTHIILHDLFLLKDCKDSSDLEERVLGEAEHNDQYAELEWNECEWTEDDNGELPEAEGEGLRWVGFTDLMVTLEQVAKSYSEEK